MSPFFFFFFENVHIGTLILNEEPKSDLTWSEKEIPKRLESFKVPLAFPCKITEMSKTKN